MAELESWMQVSLTWRIFIVQVSCVWTIRVCYPIRSSVGSVCVVILKRYRWRRKASIGGSERGKTWMLAEGERLWTGTKLLLWAPLLKLSTEVADEFVFRTQNKKHWALEGEYCYLSYSVLIWVEQAQTWKGKCKNWWRSYWLWLISPKS